MRFRTYLEALKLMAPSAQAPVNAAALNVGHKFGQTSNGYGMQVNGKLHTKSGFQVIRRKQSANPQYPWIVIGKTEFGAIVPSAAANQGGRFVVCRTDAHGHEAHPMYFHDETQAFGIFQKMP